ncbi:hypothetical protein EON64_10825, partial [archaeon]
MINILCVGSLARRLQSQSLIPPPYLSLSQIGAARASAAHFEKAGHLLAAHPSLSFSHPWLRRESEVVRGLLLFSQERVEDALDCFASILAACQKDATDPSAQAPGPSPAGPLSGLLHRVALEVERAHRQV